MSERINIQKTIIFPSGNGGKVESIYLIGIGGIAVFWVESPSKDGTGDRW